MSQCSISQSSISQGSIAVYVHIPYCTKKCPYCDFNSYSISTTERSSRPLELREKAYTNALVKELQIASEQQFWQGQQCHSIFFGGGTPSIFSPESISRIVSEINTAFLPTRAQEVTLEANPGTIQEELGLKKLSGFRDAGINRISLGIQSFQEKKLKFLGRLHSSFELDAAINQVKSAGFSNFNLDLMSGTEGETLTEWQTDIERALSYEPKHLSCYNLTIERGTEFDVRVRKSQMALPDEDTQSEMFCLTQDMLADAGFEQYEISNYSNPDFECRHNLSYWCGDSYLGLGAGAHSYISHGNIRRRWSNIPRPEHYIERIERFGKAMQLEEDIDNQRALTEFVYTRLRLTRGLSIKEACDHFGKNISDKLAYAASSQDQRFIQVNEDTIRLTKQGLLFADGIIEALIG